MFLRLATASDVPALLDIYAAYIQTPITFEYSLPSPEEFAQRVAEVQARYPYLVAEEEGNILGYAYAHPERPRAAYQWNAELSIYLNPAVVGKGLGSILCQTLLDLLRLQGVRTAYSVVTVPNPASEGLHAAFGFQRIGLHEKTGYKNGSWHDTAWFGKNIAAYTVDPAPIIPFPDLPAASVQKILAAHST